MAYIICKISYHLHLHVLLVCRLFAHSYAQKEYKDEILQFVPKLCHKRVNSVKLRYASSGSLEISRKTTCPVLFNPIFFASLFILPSNLLLISLARKRISVELRKTSGRRCLAQSRDGVSRIISSSRDNSRGNRVKVVGSLEVRVVLDSRVLVRSF